MIRKKENNYFELFVEMADYSLQAANELHQVLTNFKAGELSEILKSMHEIEHAGDAKKHDLIKKLVSEFMTPIEREDIMQLSEEIDNVIDSIEDALLRTYMFNISDIRSEALEFTEIIVKCVSALKETLLEFENFRKSSTIKQNIVEVNRLEEIGDGIYIRAMRRLYTENSDPISVMAWTVMFDQLEKCCDKCEHVADIIEDVIMKNS
jgi:Phosphate transport regulator (distant homolog of PhoU)